MMSRLKFVCAALLAAQASAASAAVIYGVGACGVLGLTASYATITEALTATPAPDVVELCPGTYREQVEITQRVTLEGASAVGADGSIMDQTIIAAPTGGLKQNSTVNAVSVTAQIFVNNVTGPVNITNITVDGTGNKFANNTVFGGPKALYGVQAYGPVSVTANNNFFEGSQIGIEIEQGGYPSFGSPTGSISNNTITGSLNGIEIDSGQVSVTSNTIYDVSGYGIALVTSVPVQGNTITQAKSGIDFGCVADNDVNSNTISATHSEALAYLPTGVTSSNTYFNVPTISGGSCPF